MERSRRNDEPTARATVRTPIGRLALEATARGIRRVEFAPRAGTNGRAARPPAPPEARRHLARAARELREYFAGRRERFEVPLDLPAGGRSAAWRALGRIPYGRTWSYGELARRLGRPGAARAAGRACATNPVPVLLPCHRVVGADGALTGFGGGLWRKQRLLELEGARLPLA